MSGRGSYAPDLKSMAALSNTHQIPLTRGWFAVVDSADKDLVAGFTWIAHPRGHVRFERGRMTVFLHRLLMGAGPDELVDHVNGNPLDNRMCNLRLATESQNAANRGPDRRKRGKTSGYKGVSLDRSRQQWIAFIHYQGKTRGLGRFQYEDEAAAAYNAAALETWGEFARLNQVPEGARGRDACDVT